MSAKETRTDTSGVKREWVESSAQQLGIFPLCQLLSLSASLEAIFPLRFARCNPFISDCNEDQFHKGKDRQMVIVQVRSTVHCIHALL